MILDSRNPILFCIAISLSIAYYELVDPLACDFIIT